MAKSIQQWLDSYGESHQNPVNKTIHWICVPIITWTVIALLWSVSLSTSVWLNLGIIFIIGALIFYLRLSVTLTIGMALFSVLCVALILWHQQTLNNPLWLTALVLFVIAWIGQFIGHKIEGKKPSFFQDIQFLMIGPAWLLSFVYRRLGLPV